MFIKAVDRDGSKLIENVNQRTSFGKKSFHENYYLEWHAMDERIFVWPCPCYISALYIVCLCSWQLSIDWKLIVDFKRNVSILIRKDVHFEYVTTDSKNLWSSEQLMTTIKKLSLRFRSNLCHVERKNVCGCQYYNLLMIFVGNCELECFPKQHEIIRRFLRNRHGYF